MWMKICSKMMGTRALISKSTCFATNVTYGPPLSALYHSRLSLPTSSHQPPMAIRSIGSSASTKGASPPTHAHKHDDHDHHHHDPEGYEPSGYFLGIPAGVKRDPFWWERLWYYGFYGSFIVVGIIAAYSPRLSIEESAKLEAQRRLMARGETFGWPYPANYKSYEPDKYVGV